MVKGPGVQVHLAGHRPARSPSPSLIARDTDHEGRGSRRPRQGVPRRVSVGCLRQPAHPWSAPPLSPGDPQAQPPPPPLTRRSTGRTAMSVVIAGGTDGIGKGIALARLTRGDTVVAFGRAPAKGRTARRLA